MSEIKVNKISPKQTCTQLTLGDSGDTIIIPAGATIQNSGTATGFGPTGAVTWDTTPKTTTVTASSGVGYFINTTSGGVTVNLPAGSAGSIVALSDYAGTWNTNAVTLNANGSEKIGGIAAPATLNTRGQAVTFVYVDSTRGWINTGDAAYITGNAFVTATGGTILTCGDYKTHVFTASGCFVVTNAGQPTGSNSVEYIVIAGGGGGAGGRAGAGGAGGFRQNYPSPTTAGLPVTATTYPITVGAGGAAGMNDGNNSIFSTITSAKGGGGGNFCSTGNSGGSGGGGGGGGPGDGSPLPVAGGAGNTPPVSPSQGNAGGTGAGQPAYGGAGGGGGGVGGAGSNAPGPIAGGAGGVGTPVSPAVFGPTAPSYGTPGPAPGRYFAGGGGGGTTIRTYPGYYSTNGGPGGPGGAGGGGKGAGNDQLSAGVDGTANTGGGAGGGGADFTPGSIPSNGGAGGSGIVVIRYKYQ